MSRFDEGQSRVSRRGHRRPDAPALPSMIRVVKHGYRAEPKLLWASLAMTALEALPDVLVGIWLALITDGPRPPPRDADVRRRRRTRRVRDADVGAVGDARPHGPDDWATG